MSRGPHGTPDWEQVYADKLAEKMPWYYPELEQDLREVFSRLANQGGTVLDLGTGPGTQAVGLAGMGFRVTASDIAPSAVEQAKALAAQQGAEVDFVQDDILHTKLTGPFDYVLDRGCFHSLPAAARPLYAAAVFSLLKSKGRLILKCFSHKYPGTHGPARLSPEEIHQCFDPQFKVLSVEDSLFQVLRESPPDALLCVLEKP
ncbi:MAG TPA: class I SAM-dependent methyltransferase [Bacillota bacterium]|nr:class I SAM-dependent methyltransferase [Bacillota bacterium]